MIFHSLVLAAGSIVAAAASVSCDDGSIDDIYRGDSSGEYVSETDWTEAADLSTETYIKYFFENAGGGDTFGGSIWWEKPNTPQTGEPSSADGSGGWSQGHALDIVTDYYIRHSDDPELQKKIYDEIMVPFLPAFDDWNRTCGYGGNDFWNNFYDDMEWMALACLRVYELTGDENYYDALMKMWGHIKEAKNDYKGAGGMAWKTDSPASRMSCSNGPGCLLAMKLYRLTVTEAREGWEEQAAYYLNFAKEVYSWMTAYLCDTSTGQVYDNLGINDDGTIGTPDQVALSYNQGTFMASALALYNATGEDEYLRNAVSFASYQVNRKMDSDYPVFSGEGSSGDNLLFRGIFVRYFLDMLKQPTNDVYTESTKSKFIAALRSCTDVMWSLAHPEGWYVWEYSWSSAPDFGNRNDNPDRLTIELNAEVPGATAIEIRARYEDWVQGRESESENWTGPEFNPEN